MGESLSCGTQPNGNESRDGVIEIPTSRDSSSTGHPLAGRDKRGRLAARPEERGEGRRGPSPRVASSAGESCRRRRRRAPGSLSLSLSPSLGCLGPRLPTPESQRPKSISKFGPRRQLQLQACNWASIMGPTLAMETLQLGLNSGPKLVAGLNNGSKVGNGWRGCVFSIFFQLLPFWFYKFLQKKVQEIFFKKIILIYFKLF